MAVQTIQANLLISYDEDTGGAPEAEMNSFIKDQVVDHAAAIGRTYDGMTVEGVFTSSLTGTETF